MGSKPTIKTYNKKQPKKVDPSFAGRVAIIGAFKSEVVTPKSYSTLTEAVTDLGAYDSSDVFLGNKALNILFGKDNTGKDIQGVTGVTSILAVNVATKSGSTWTKTLDATSLTTALGKIKYESFDYLFIATDDISDALLAVITPFTSERHLNKHPCGYGGYIAARTGESASAIKQAYKATADATDDFCYGLIPAQTVKINGATFDALETSAYYCALLASTNVGSSLTQKTLPAVEGLGTEYSFETASVGEYLVEYGFMAIDCYDRENSEYLIVNSEQPNGYDLYINRVRDYVLRAFNLHQFLGERNRTPTLSEIGAMLSLVKESCVKNLDFLADIEYTVEKVAPKKARVTVTKLLFDDIITDIEVYYTIEVQ